MLTAVSSAVVAVSLTATGPSFAAVTVTLTVAVACRRCRRRSCS